MAPNRTRHLARLALAFVCVLLVVATGVGALESKRPDITFTTTGGGTPHSTSTAADPLQRFTAFPVSGSHDLTVLTPISLTSAKFAWGAYSATVDTDTATQMTRLGISKASVQADLNAELSGPGDAAILASATAALNNNQFQALASVVLSSPAHVTVWCGQPAKAYNWTFGVPLLVQCGPSVPNTVVSESFDCGPTNMTDCISAHTHAGDATEYVGNARFIVSVAPVYASLDASTSTVGVGYGSENFAVSTALSATWNVWADIHNSDQIAPFGSARYYPSSAFRYADRAFYSHGSSLLGGTGWNGTMNTSSADKGIAYKLDLADSFGSASQLDQYVRPNDPAGYNWHNLTWVNGAGTAYFNVYGPSWQGLKLLDTNDSLLDGGWRHVYELDNGTAGPFSFVYGGYGDNAEMKMTEYQGATPLATAQAVGMPNRVVVRVDPSRGSQGVGSVDLQKFSGEDASTYFFTTVMTGHVAPIAYTATSSLVDRAEFVSGTRDPYQGDGHPFVTHAVAYATDNVNEVSGDPGISNSTIGALTGAPVTGFSAQMFNYDATVHANWTIAAPVCATNATGSCWGSYAPTSVVAKVNVTGTGLNVYFWDVHEASDSSDQVIIQACAQTRADGTCD